MQWPYSVRDEKITATVPNSSRSMAPRTLLGFACLFECKDEKEARFNAEAFAKLRNQLLRRPAVLSAISSA